jgi:quinol monooxygenase YgiN
LRRVRPKKIIKKKGIPPPLPEKDNERGIIRLTSQEDGCLVFEVSQDEENLNKFNVYEEFIDRDSFSAHQKRVHESNWGAITVNVERHYQITDVN